MDERQHTEKALLIAVAAPMALLALAALGIVGLRIETAFHWAEQVLVGFLVFLILRTLWRALVADPHRAPATTALVTGLIGGSIGLCLILGGSMLVGRLMLKLGYEPLGWLMEALASAPASAPRAHWFEVVATFGAIVIINATGALLGKLAMIVALGVTWIAFNILAGLAVMVAAGCVAYRGARRLAVKLATDNSGSRA
jgi:hypothetical protein